MIGLDVRHIRALTGLPQSSYTIEHRACDPDLEDGLAGGLAEHDPHRGIDVLSNIASSQLSITGESFRKAMCCSRS